MRSTINNRSGYYYNGLIPNGDHQPADQVVDVHEYNMPDYSYWTAVVYRPADGNFYVCEAGEWPYVGAPRINATKEVKDLFAKVLQCVRNIEAIERRIEDKYTPAVGKVARVKDKTNTGRTRKNAGFTGQIFWTGSNQFRTYYRNGYNRPEDNMVAGLQSAAGEKKFIPFDQLEVIAA